MKESEHYEKVQRELLEFMENEAQELDYPVVQKKLNKFASRCWCSMPNTADSEENVMDNFFFLLGWLESRINLRYKQWFKKCHDGVPFLYKFKEVLQVEEAKNED